MFDTYNLLYGLEHLFKEIDYGRVSRANPYYQKILSRTPVPAPQFFSTIDRARLDTGAIANSDQTPQEQAYLRLMELANSKEAIERSDLLGKLRDIGRLFPRDLPLHLTFAKILIKHGFYPDATHYLERCLQLDTKCDFAWAHLALIAAISQDHGRAIFCARKALELGNHLNNTLQKAYVFSLLAMGTPAKVGPFDTAAHFQIEEGDLKLDTNSVPTPTFEQEPAQLANQPIVFFACDDGYFERFGKNLLISLAEVSDTVTPHIHLVNPSSATLNWLSTYSETVNDQTIVSYEDLGTAKLAENKAYLASCRFIHAREFLKRHDRDYLVIDADSILNATAGLKSFLQQAETPVLYYSERGPIWDTLSAPFTYLPRSDISRDFADHIYQYLVHMFFSEGKQPFWYIDQLALLGAYLRFSDKIAFCPAQLISDVHCSENAIFWTLSNDKNRTEYQARCNQLQQTDVAKRLST